MNVLNAGSLWWLHSREWSDTWNVKTVSKPLFTLTGMWYHADPTLDGPDGFKRTRPAHLVD